MKNRIMVWRNSSTAIVYKTQAGKPVLHKGIRLYPKGEISSSYNYCKKMEMLI